MIGQKFRAGLVQMCSGREVERNIADASALIREAAAAGAEFIATPEMTNILDTDRQRVASSVQTEAEDPAPRAFSQLAKDIGVHLLIGSLALRSAQQKLVNRSLLFSPEGEVLARYENYMDLDPEVKDKWGVPVLRFHYKFGDNEKKMVDDMAVVAHEMFEEAGFEIVDHGKQILTEGWSNHELGTARMGNDPKSSVLNQFQQSHDVRNLFVVDGSSHVSASCQNPTWTIMALAWRSCDYLASEFRKGNL